LQVAQKKGRIKIRIRIKIMKRIKSKR